MRYRYCESCEQMVESQKFEFNSRIIQVCPDCEATIDLGGVPSKMQFIGAGVQDAEFNPAFGCVVKNKQHRAELAKQKGMEEVGNEPVANIHKHFDTERARKLEKSWEDV